MNHFLNLTSSILIMFSAALHAQAPLSVLYGSGPYTDNGINNIDLLTSSDRAEELIGWDGSALSYQPMQDWILPGWKSISSPQSGYPYIGFRSEGDSRRVNPVFWNGTDAPPEAFYAQLATDPAGDHLFTNPALDLLELSVSFTDTKLYFSIRNSSGSYPTSSGAITFYSYMALIIDPEVDPDTDPIVFSLMHTVNVTGVIGPGLYKITGSGTSDQIQIGEIDQSIEDGALIMSCNLSDLLADPDFNAWFDTEYPLISCGSMTARITLTSGVQEADASDGAEVLLMDRALPVQNISEPVLSAARVDTGVVSDIHYAQGYVTYFDADANFPRLATFQLDDADAVPLYILPGQSPMFEQSVSFYSEMLPFDGEWSVARFRFAHGDTFVEEMVINQVANSDPDTPAPLILQTYPNPASGLIKLQVTGVERYELSMYNVKGQRLLSYSSDHATQELDLSAFAPGIYLLRIDSARGSVSRRIVKSR